MTLGQKLKKLRTEKNLTQKDLADQLHVTFQTVSKWEGDTNEPDIATLKELAKFFGCSFDYLLSDEEAPEETPEPEPETATEEQVTKKDIPEDELVSEDVTRKERHGRATRTVSVGQTYYHKRCLEEVKKERAATARRVEAARASSSRKKCFGWGIAGGAVALVIALLIFLLVPSVKEVVHPALAVLYSVIISYGIFAMVYCILSGSYIGDVFVWCASLSIKFPGLIFTWDLDGFAWLIAMKILFAVLGFLIGVFALLFAIAFSATLGAVSFPFVLIHNIRTDYEDAF